jgi:hypothetical protein
MVGAAPNTEWLSGLVKLDDKGFVITGFGGIGVFALGTLSLTSRAAVAFAFTVRHRHHRRSYLHSLPYAIHHQYVYAAHAR